MARRPLYHRPITAKISAPSPRLQLSLIDGGSLSRVFLSSTPTPFVLPTSSPLATALDHLRAGLDANYSSFSASANHVDTRRQGLLFSRVNCVFRSTAARKTRKKLSEIGPRVLSRRLSFARGKPKQIPSPGVDVVDTTLTTWSSSRGAIAGNSSGTATVRKVSFACVKPSAVLSPCASEYEPDLAPWTCSRSGVTVEDVEDVDVIWSAWDTPKGAKPDGPEKKVSFAMPGNKVSSPRAMPLWSVADVAEDDNFSDSDEYDTCGATEFGSVLHAVRKISRKLAPAKREDEREQKNLVPMLEDDFISFACARETGGRGRRYGGVRGFLAKVVSRF